ncbi:MAG: hypothetical protein C4291_03750 [Candidatus Dadabacteria bacterium]
MKISVSSKRLWFVNLIILVVSVIISLVFVELILRVRDWYNPDKIGFQQSDEKKPYEFSTTRHHRLIPNARYRHIEPEFNYIWANNSLGMRDRERPLKKRPGSFRILFLGDSFVQGWGVPLEQTMTILLENSLNKPKREKTIEVLNAGVFGYGPFLEYLYLKELMPSVEPDLVIVGFFPGNDVGDDYFYTHHVHFKADRSVFFDDRKWPWSYRDEVLDGTASKTAHNSYISSLWNRFKPWLLRSHLVLVIKNLSVQIKYRREKEQERKLVQDRRDDIRINLGLVNYPVLDRNQRLDYWKLSRGYLADIHRLCKMRGIPMVLVVIPALYIFEENQFKEPYEVLDEIGRELSIPVIQLLLEFQKWSHEKLEYKIDLHWNSNGNRLAAAILDRELRKLNLLPPIRSR